MFELSQIRKILVFMLGVLTISIAGCSAEVDEDSIKDSLNSYIEKSVIEESTIETEDDYLKYEELKQNEKIDEVNHYSDEEVDPNVLEDKNAIYITFAENSYIHIDYYYDKALSKKIESNSCYMHTNDCIYASNPEIDNPNTPSYQFECFEIWQFEDNVKKKKLETSNFKDSLVYQIPMDFKGTGISIVPLGKYVAKEITLNDYYKDLNGVEQSLRGRWEIDDSSTDGDSITVNPVASYAITYKYNTEEFEFVKSDPACLYNNEQDGIVSFEEYTADKDITNFSVELHKKGGDKQFDPGKYQNEHAEIVYKYQGQIITEPTYISKEGKIAYEIKDIEDGYWAPDGNTGDIEVSGVISEIVDNLICKKEEVTVSLPQPERGGTISYFLNGKELSGESERVVIGSKIELKFKYKNGWSCHGKDGYEYKVISKEIQRISVNGKDVNDIFFEKENKPVVKLTADKSIGTNVVFNLTSVDGEQKGLKLDDDKKSKELFVGELGTKKDLIISLSTGTVFEGEAIRLTINSEGRDDKKRTDIQYVKKIPADITIPLYTNDSTVFKNVSITASRVKVESFNQKNIDNGKIIVKTTDLTDNRELGAYDVIEGTRKVELSILANNGFYVKGSGKSPEYRDTVKFSKYISDIDSVIAKHPVKKLCQITLNGSDPYGTITFEIDGKKVEPGSYLLKEEQKLSLSYVITDNKHHIKRSGEGPLGLIDKAKSKTKESTNISITYALDGSTVSREQYISVE